VSITDFVQQGTIGSETKPKRYDIDMYQGDTFQFYLTFGGSGLDVTGWAAASTVKTMDGTSTVSGVITIGAIDTTNKRFLVTVDSDLLDPALTYKYDIQVTDSGGNKRTFIGGKISTTEDITEP
jgi:hypothetical protein